MIFIKYVHMYSYAWMCSQMNGKEASEPLHGLIKGFILWTCYLAAPLANGPDD